MLGIDSDVVKKYGVARTVNSLSNSDYSYINLSGNKLGLVELNTLKYALQRCHHIYKVIMDDCEIDDVGCETLFDILTEVPSVLHLSIRNNKITDVGLSVLCAGLHQNKTLLELFLSGNTLITYVGMIAIGDVLMENPSLCTLGFMNIPERQNCLFSREAIANNFAMLFLFTGNKNEERMLDEITSERHKLFTEMSCLIGKGDNANILTYLSVHAQCLEQGGYNAIKYYLVFDEGEINLRLPPLEANEKLSQLKAMVEELGRLRTPALVRQPLETEKKRAFQSQEPTLTVPQEDHHRKKKRRVPLEQSVAIQGAAEAGQINR